MIVINNIDDKRFSLNGIKYFKNFTPHVVDENIRIVNTYDSTFILLNWTPYDQFEVNGSTFNSVSDLQKNILTCLFTRTSLSDKGGFVNLNKYNVKGDGITDDTEALQKAILDAYTNNLNLISDPNKIYKVSSDISINHLNEKGFILDWNNSKILLENAKIEFEVNQNLPYLVTSLNSDMVKGDITIDVADVTDVSEGDIIMITSPAIVSNGINHVQTYVVKDIVGNEIYTEMSIVSDCNNQQIIDSGQTGNIEVRFYKTSKNLRMKRATFISDKQNEYVFHLKNQHNLILEDINIVNASRYGCYIQYCGNANVINSTSYKHGYVTNSDGYNNNPSDPGGFSFGYGFIVARSAYAKFDNVRGGYGWHTFDAAIGQTYTDYVNCTSLNDAFGFSTHEGAWQVYYRNNKSIGGYGITVRGVYVDIIDNIIEPSIYGHGIAAGTDFSMRVNIKGNLIKMNRNSTNSFLYNSGSAIVSDAGSVSLGHETKQVHFVSNIVENCGVGYAKAENNLIFNNNILKGSCAIDFQAEDIIAENNIIENIRGQFAFQVKMRGGETILLRKNIVKGSVGSQGGSALVFFQNNGNNTENIIIEDNNIEAGTDYVFRCLNNDITFKEVTKNRGFKVLALANNTHTIELARENVSITSQENLTLGGVGVPDKYFRETGTTASRPASVPIGYQYFDTTLGYQIYWNGANWVDGVGTTV